MFSAIGGMASRALGSTQPGTVSVNPCTGAAVLISVSFCVCFSKALEFMLL